MGYRMYALLGLLLACAAMPRGAQAGWVAENEAVLAGADIVKIGGAVVRQFRLMPGGTLGGMPVSFVMVNPGPVTVSVPEMAAVAQSASAVSASGSSAALPKAGIQSVAGTSPLEESSAAGTTTSAVFQTAGFPDIPGLFVGAVVVPEPLSLSLLATMIGLVGLVRRGLMRRDVALIV